MKILRRREGGRAVEHLGTVGKGVKLGHADLPERGQVEAKLGVDASTATTNGYLRSEHGPGNKELETYIHPGGHDIPPEVPPLIVDFFKRHSLSAG